MTLTTFTWYWLPVLIWMGCIFGFSTDRFAASNTGSIIEPLIKRVAPTLSGEALDYYHFLIRKTAHLVEYAVLSFLVLRALRQGAATRWTWRWAIITLWVVAGYAFSDEWHQSFTAERRASLADAGLDTAGGLAMQIYLAAYYKIRGQRPPAHRDRP